jgi:hypothetical protein
MMAVRRGGSGTSTLDDRDETAPYHRLIRAMQAEVSNILPPSRPAI